MNEQQESRRQIESGEDNAEHVETKAPMIVCVRKDSMPRKMRSRIFVDLQPDEWDGIVTTTAKSSLQAVPCVVRDAIREHLHRQGLLPQRDNDRVGICIQTRAGRITSLFKATIRKYEFDGLVEIAKHDGDTIGRTLANAVMLYVALRGVDPLPEYLASVEHIRTERDVILAAGPGEIRAGEAAQPQGEPAEQN